MTPEEQIEKLQVQLAGCSVAALGHATGSNDCEEGAYGWSVAFDDVKNLRKKYDDLMAASIKATVRHGLDCGTPGYICPSCQWEALLR